MEMTREGGLLFRSFLAFDFSPVYHMHAFWRSSSMPIVRTPVIWVPSILGTNISLHPSVHVFVGKSATQNFNLVLVTSVSKSAQLHDRRLCFDIPIKIHLFTFKVEGLYPRPIVSEQLIR